MSPSIQLLIDAAAGFILQLIVLGGIPLLVHAITRRRIRGFPEWIGLKRAPATVILFACAAAALLAAVTMAMMWPALKQEGTVSGGLLAFHAGHGWTAALIATLLITAWLKTALTEEIFFRGFVARRLIGWLGFGRGNAIQAALFGLVHLPILFVLPREQLGAMMVFAIIAGPAAGGWLMGYFNHRRAGGSILPGICMHGLGNTIAYAMPLVLA